MELEVFREHGLLGWRDASREEWESLKSLLQE